jgi:hypothetical protein
MPSTIQLATLLRWKNTTGHSANPCASSVTTACQGSRFGIRSQHSSKQERDHPCEPNTLRILTSLNETLDLRA